MIKIVFARFAFATHQSPIHTPLAIIGGGTGGINVSAQIISDKQLRPDKIRIFEPRNIHTYCPGWTLVCAGQYDITKTMVPMDQIIYKGVQRTTSAVSLIDPTKNTIFTDDGGSYTYDQLVIASGMNLDWSQIKGAKEALDDPNIPVGSAYQMEYASKMNRLSGSFQGGRAVFTEPQMPVKCPGAAQKVVYLVSERFINNKVKADVHFHKTIPVLFGIKKYAEKLQLVVDKRGINLHLKSKLLEVKGKERIAVFENQDTKKTHEEPFDLLHIVPPQKPPKFIAASGLADKDGFVDVHPGTMQHVKYSNVWSLGDSSNLPTSKTAAGVMNQTGLLVSNMMNFWSGKPFTAPEYDGYTCCPVITSSKTVLLCEFKYKGEVTETFPWLQQTDNYLMYLLKKVVFPFAYFKFMPMGLWAGRTGFRMPHLLKSYER